MPAAFINLLKRNAKEVQELTGEHAAQFLDMLTSLRTELRGRLDAIAPSDADFTAYNLNAVLRETELGIDMLERRAKTAFGAVETDAIDLSIKHTVEEIERLSRTFDVAPLPVSIDAARVLADPARELLAEHFGTSMERYGAEVLNNVRQRLFVAMRTGDPYADVVKDVAGEEGPLGTVGQPAAERIIRTETRNIYGAAQHKAMDEAKREVPGLKKTWLHVGAYRCDVCMPLHGTSRPLDGTWTIRVSKTKTKQVVHPPAHPSCVCRIAAMKPSWRDKLVGLGYLEQDPEDPKSKPTDI